MNELNLILQGKENFICDLCRNITVFRSTTRRKFVSFSVFPGVCTENAQRDANLEFQKKIIQYLDTLFRQIFLSWPNWDDIRLFENPFGCNLENMPTELQLELIDPQANTLMKEKHTEGKPIGFFRCSPNDGFSKLRKFAAGMASVFGTIYICEQTFSSMKYVKSMYWTGLWSTFESNSYGWMQQP